MQELLLRNDDTKVDEVISIFRTCGVDEWARSLKDRYVKEAFDHLEDVAVLSKRKEPLQQLAHYLVHRDM